MSLKAEDFISFIEMKRFDKISRDGQILIAERFREIEAENKQFLKTIGRGKERG
jgi:hypothetical protein